MNEDPPLLEAVGLTVRYGPRAALQDVSLTIRPGEFVALAGPNGAGKTTFVRAVLGLVAPAEGRIFVRGSPLGALSYRERARRMAWLPQEEQPQDNVPILDYVLYRAMSKDDTAGNPAGATAHFQAFTMALGVKTQVANAENPNVQPGARK